jgi:hypothetical protein
MKKWEYRIFAKIKGRRYLIHKYPRTFEELAVLTKRQKRLLKKKGFTSLANFEGTSHSNSAVGWILGLQRDLKKWNSFDNLDNEITKEGLFNPYFKVNDETSPAQWFNASDVKDIS